MPRPATSSSIEAIHAMSGRQARFVMLCQSKPVGRLCTVAPQELRNSQLKNSLAQSVEIERTTRGLASEMMREAMAGIDGAPATVQGPRLPQGFDLARLNDDE